MKKTFLAILLSFFVTNNAKADCFCACIDGKNQAICTGSLNIKPICPFKFCP